MTAIKQLTP